MNTESFKYNLIFYSVLTFILHLCLFKKPDAFELMIKSLYTAAKIFISNLNLYYAY